ncbi:hypothetical protein EXE59_02265 [Nocardioides eburneiflavus]|uniref:Calcium-binding protein n=1 Tax=Nocardioides eburneiflavus TaxID=2518372 RepID=A0A4Z1CIY9_9ACTN|nr:hypothetical protein [Nocardioides eburneiflavus]TGN62900.1 hypothetical protein EXE59_02265 [Nocardioides eburneiflavus]
MRRTTTLTAAGLIGLALLTPTAGSAADESCLWEPATLVGTPDHPLVGTDGRDVIVTNGATEVTALGGDDRICVTGKRHPWIAVDAGAGNDVVDGQHRSGQPVFADLGTGTDVFVGGDDDDRVTLAYPDAGGGPDVVTGGDGDDTIQLQTGPGDARVDNALGTFSSSGAALARWSGVEEFWLAEPPSPRALTFVGSRRRDTVVDDARTPSVVHVTLDVGADAYRSRTAPLPGSSISGGVGSDLIEVASPTSGLHLDLQRQRMVVDDTTAYTGRRQASRTPTCSRGRSCSRATPGATSSASRPAERSSRDGRVPTRSVASTTAPSTPISTAGSPRASTAVPAGTC